MTRGTLAGASTQIVRVSWLALSGLGVVLGCGSSGDPARPSGDGGTPGTTGATGGIVATGGGPTTGGMGAIGGGAGTESGGAQPTGGSPPTGGTSSPTGGVAAGGSNTGGLPTGGVTTGGQPTGGVATGGVATGGSGPTGGGAGCDGGPLSEPLPNCSPTPVPDTGDYYADCVDRINQFRWECQCLPPLERWFEAEACADQQAQYDYEQDDAHAGFSDRICEPGGSAQNECPGYGPSFGIVDFCLQQMWDEGPGEPFSVHGHYINMSNPDFTKVACGHYTTPGGDVWAVQNFSR